MKKFSLFGALAAVAVLGVTSCGSSGQKVLIGLHANLGAGAGYSAINQGYFKEQGLDVVHQIGTGSSLATQVLSNQIQVSFMGGGVAWNYFTDNSKIKIVALDNLTDDDRLIAKKDGNGANLTLNSSLEEIGEALKGSTVAFDRTATPATFWTNLVAEVNTVLDEGDRIWYDGDAGKLPVGLTDADYVDANKVTIHDVTNANISTSAQKSDWDFVIAFAPVATQLEKDTANWTTVCKTSTHMSDSYAPSTWAVNTDWLKDNKETFKKFMVGLVKGMNFRNQHVDETCKDIEAVSAGQVSASSLTTDIAVWLSAQQQLDLYNSGDMMKYVENIRNGQLSGENKDKIKKTAAEACDFSYLLEACNTVLGK